LAVHWWTAIDVLPKARIKAVPLHAMEALGGEKV
jgi:hypothetical protein